MIDTFETLELSASRSMRDNLLANFFVCERCFSPFTQYMHLIKRRRQEKLVKMKSTQSVLTTTHWASLWCGWSPWFCCFGFGSSWCIFWVFWLVFRWSSVFFPSVASAGSEVVCGSMSSPWFPFKKPTLMLLNASSRQWAVQVGYKLTK